MKALVICDICKDVYGCMTTFNRMNICNPDCSGVGNKEECEKDTDARLTGVCSRCKDERRIVGTQKLN